MSKPRHLRSVPAQQRPLAKLSQAEKLVEAIRFLRERHIYVLDAGSPAKFGIPYVQQPESALMKAVMEADRRRK